MQEYLEPFKILYPYGLIAGGLVFAISSGLSYYLTCGEMKEDRKQFLRTCKKSIEKVVK